MANVARGELLASLTSWRFVAASGVTGFLAVLFAWRLAASANPVPGSETFPLWVLGADGAFAAFVFGFVPLVLPLIPLVLIYDVTKRDAQTGFLETAMSRSVPSWSVALGRYAGLTLAVFVPFTIIDATSTLVIGGTVGVSVSPDFAGVFIAATFLLGALYVALGLVLTRFLTAGQFAWIVFPVWVYTNGASPFAFLVAGQFLLIFPITGPVLFTPSWAHWLSFTGMYQSLLAASVPAGLGFVVIPTIDDLSGTLAHSSSILAGLPWLVLLVALLLALVSRAPLGK